MLLKCFKQSFLVLTLLAALPVVAIEVGTVAPSFDLPGPTANVKLDSLRGKVVYVDFWASWCGPCKQSFPWMNALHKRFSDKGLQVVAINVDAKSADATAFLKSSSPEFAIAFDHAGVTPKAYGVKAMPSSYLIGPDGKVLKVHTGFREVDRGELETSIQLALASRN